MATSWERDDAITSLGNTTTEDVMSQDTAMVQKMPIEDDGSQR